MIRRVETEADYELCARIKNTVQPAEPITVAELREDPRASLLIHGEAGYAIVKESSLAGCTFTMVRVLPDARRRGVGSSLLAAASCEARALGKGALYGRVDADDPESLAWVERRGFVVVSRDVVQIRELGDEPAPEAPPGIELGELRPEHLEGVYAVHVDATPDMAVDAEIAARPYEHWLELTATRIVMVALEDGRVVGCATLVPLAAQPDALEHELTGVLRSHRRRGIAEALKRGQIHWAATHGYRRLITWTQEGNDAMRGLNLKLGYRERLDSVSVKGPLQA
jgi:GNAT superfamily N-acetyltransferase